MSKTRKDAIEALQSIGWTVEEIVEALGAQTVIYNQLPQVQPTIEAKGFRLNRVRGTFDEYPTVECGFHQGFSEGLHAVMVFNRPQSISDAERDRLLTEIAEIHQEVGAYGDPPAAEDP